MQGEKLGEAAGTVTGIRVLRASGTDSEIEVSFSGEGTILGSPIRDFGTYEQITRPDGSVYGHGDVLMMTQDGATLPWSGFGVGVFLPDGALTFGVAGAFHGAPTDRFGLLNRVATILEYEVEADRSYRWTCWAWTGARAPAE